MKNLSIEEKAKRYDEAKINGSRLWECGEITRENYEYMFPELKENWNEKVRKWLIEMVEEVRKANPTNAEHNGMCSEAIAWIEKQGEQTIEEFARKVTHDKVYAIAFLKSAGIMNEDGQLAEEYRTEADTDKSEQNPAWSEEDEKTIDEAVECLENYVEYVQGGFSKQHVLDLASRVESLKDRYFWKPSDEQLEALEHSLGDYNIKVFEDRYEILKSLYNDLKKLK